MRLSCPRTARVAALAAAVVLGACQGGGGGTTPAGALQVAAEGRVERGGIVTLSATRDGQAVPAASVAWSVTPADAAQPLDGGRIQLLRAGDVQVRATAGGRTGTLALQVQAPPTVVFEMAVNGNLDLYRVGLDGGDLARLTHDPANDGDPAVAGGTVVFVSVRAGNAELYSVPLAGGAETRLTTTPRAEAAPALSRDGRRLAYASDASGVAKVWTAQANGTGAAAAAPGFGFAGSPETSPSWTPAGDRLAFVGTATGSADVYRLTPGGHPELLAGGPAADIDPAWSPDGQDVAFASTRQGGGADLYLLRAGGGPPARLTTRAGDEAEPAWTQDGRLVYVELGPGGASRLVWMDPAHPDTVHPVPVQGGHPRSPAVNP